MKYRIVEIPQNQFYWGKDKLPYSKLRQHQMLGYDEKCYEVYMDFGDTSILSCTALQSIDNTRVNIFDPNGTIYMHEEKTLKEIFKQP